MAACCLQPKTISNWGAGALASGTHAMATVGSTNGTAGIGPHDIKRLPASDVLVVANGGIDTHPDTGRTKLNLPTMRPNLAYIDNGQIIDSVAGPPDLHKNSIRHLAVGASGMVAFAMQWQGGGPARTLVGVHRLGQPIRFMAAKADELRKMDGYVGSIALSADEQMIAVTSPRGGILQEYGVNTLRFLKSSAIPDVSGVAAFGEKFALSAGTGEMSLHGKDNARLVRRTPVHWDNHLIAVAAG